MKNVLKKGISILSVIAIILTMFPAAFTAFAAETKVQIENADALATKKGYNHRRRIYGPRRRLLVYDTHSRQHEGCILYGARKIRCKRRYV